MNSKLLPLLVLIGGALGISIGSFSPALTAFLQPFGDAYIRLMEVVVLPYLISSLLLGLGRLSPATALRQAQEHVRSQEKWKHPYYWAAWVLWGLPN